jgi:hypothetical protein
MPRCPDCGADVRAGENICHRCRREIPASFYAPPGGVDDETLILHLLDAPSRASGEARVARIWLLDPSGSQVEQALDLENPITQIGRSRECAVYLPSNTVSRHHAQIRREEERYLVKDLGSTNGTLLNGETVVGEEALKDLDEIGIGIYRLIFRGN